MFRASFIGAVSLISLLMVGSADARPRGSVSYTPPPPSGPCPHSAAGYADGCAGANQSALYIFPNFFTDVRQSGQAQYKAAGGSGSDHPPPWDVAGVDYPVGQYTPDAGLIDATVSAAAGCSIDLPNRRWNCGAGPIVVDGYRFNGMGIIQGGTPNGMTINNSHFTLTSQNCRFYTGTAPVNVNGPLTVTNNTTDFSDDCQMTAKLYKTAADPGFITQSSGDASFNGTTLTYSAINSGTVRVGAWIDYPGMINGPVQITAGSGLVWTVSVSQGTVTGPVTVTTGPTENAQNGAFFNGGRLTAKYNANFGWGQFLNSGQAVGDQDIQYNYSKMLVKPNQHVNFAIKIPGPGTINNWLQKFNTVYWDQNSYIENGGGTSTIDMFATLDISGAGSTITTLADFSYNTIVANKSLTPAGGFITNSMLRVLSQGGANNANITYGLSGGVLNVTAFNSGAALAVGQYISCATCTRTTKITSLGTGTGGTGTYNVDNNADTVASATSGVYLYPGKVTALNWVENYGDITGTNGGFFNLSDQKLVEIGTKNITGNINMLNGNVCTPGGSC